MNIRDGDVFRWYFKNDEEYRKKLQGSGTAYWCMDNKCFATERSGEIYLLDTYWARYDAEYIGSEVTYVDPDKCDLEFVCNLHDVHPIQKYEIEDYDKVYNLSRQKGCYHFYAVDKDAKASNKALLEKYKRKLKEAESDMRSAVWDIEKYKELIEGIGE